MNDPSHMSDSSNQPAGRLASLGPLPTAARVGVVVSLLHEKSDAANFARLLHGRSVLSWTLARAARVEGIERVVIVCFDDQVERAKSVASATEADVVSVGERRAMPQMDSVTIARRWSDGWRGGPMGASGFDRGFDAPAGLTVCDRFQLSDLIWVDPASVLLDADVLTRLIKHAADRETMPLLFTQAPPGGAAPMLRRTLIEQLAPRRSHPGLLLSYRPERPGVDPIGSPACMRLLPQITRSTQNLLADSTRSIRAIETAIPATDLPLISMEQAIGRMDAVARCTHAPRALTIELTTRRATRAIFRPAVDQHPNISRADLSIETLIERLGRLDAIDDLRVTLAGVGDPILHPEFERVIKAIHHATRGTASVAVETDLLSMEPDAAKTEALGRRLSQCGVDVIAIHIPAVGRATYAEVMGADRMNEMLGGVRAMLAGRGGSQLPLVVPMFVKCRVNQHEMEAWYDQWLTAVGSAAIVGPSDFGGLIEDVGVVDMSPSVRRACVRLRERMTLLSDGRWAICERDAAGVTRLAEGTLAEVWGKTRGTLEAQRAGLFSGVCGDCREWFRP